MKTRRLFYEDCDLTRFEARVMSCEKTEKGWQVVLDATAFYPEGGGQACDIGTLGGVRVLDVQEIKEQIVHLCDGALEVGALVEGQIDWDRRFDLMQQHTGEHIVSGILHKHFGYHNTGFHVGKDVMEVDFDGPLTPEQLAMVEREANEAVWKNIPLRCWYPDPEELKNVVYRTKRELPWPVRIVQIPGVDSCACCGIHVSTTGQAGPIKVISCVKFHGGVRLEMVCGARAWRYLEQIFEQNRRISQQLSAKMPETAEAVRKLGDALSAERIRGAALEKKLAELIAESYVNQKNVLRFEPEMFGGQLRNMADQIARRCQGFAAVFSGTDENGYGYCIAAQDVDLRPLGKALNSALSGRGGGKSEAQQGTVKATRQQIEEFFGNLK